MGRQPRKSDAPADRLGVYDRLSDVPDRHRLHHHADAYEGEDTWQVFCDEKEYAEGSHARHEMEVDRVGDRWKSFMAERERHHALALPEDVDEWCAELRESLSVRRSFEHWRRVERFYDWLQWHADRPHLYNPAMQAAARNGDARVLWEWWVTRTQQRRPEYGAETDE